MRDNCQGNSAKQHRRKKGKMKRLQQLALAGIMATVLVTVSGCTTAGPFVTNVSSDGKGGLIIEKNMVHLNAFWGVMSIGETPTTQVVQVLPESEIKQK